MSSIAKKLPAIKQANIGKSVRLLVHCKLYCKRVGSEKKCRMVRIVESGGTLRQVRQGLMGEVMGSPISRQQPFSSARESRGEVVNC